MSDEAPVSRRPIRIGLLGAARIAPMALVQPAAETDGVTVHAVAARDRERASAFANRHGIPVVHGSYDDLIADPDIDLVYNPLPNGLHGVWSVRALEAGKHVLCEKPIAANADEAREMVDAAARCDRRLIEAFHYRYHPLVERVREIIRSGEIGAVRRYEASFIVPIVRGGDIRYRFDLAGGATMDLGCYPIHFLRTLAGAEPAVKRATAVEAPADIDRTMDAELEFPGAIPARVQCSMWSPKILRVGASIEGENGRIDVFNFVAPQIYNSVKVRSANGSRRERIKGPATYTAQLRAVAAAVREGTALPTEGEDGIFNMRVIDAMYDAAGLPRRAPSAP
jgi:predicted dehydrogenase